MSARDVADIVASLGGRWNPARGTATCRCPAHDDRSPSLSVKVTREGKLLLKCFSGCSQEAVLAAWFALGGGGAAPEATPRDNAPDPDYMRAARRIWREAIAIPGTPAAEYLAWRGLNMPIAPDVLRFHRSCWCTALGERLPAMIARTSDPVTGELMGIQRIYLRPNGKGRALKEKPMLGPAGIVRLYPDEDVTIGLGIAEGIETALSVATRGWQPVWAALTAGGIERFPVLPGIEALAIFADNDESGRGVQAARQCARHWAAAGREVRITYPEITDTDWADPV